MKYSSRVTPVQESKSQAIVSTHTANRKTQPKVIQASQCRQSPAEEDTSQHVLNLNLMLQRKMHIYDIPSVQMCPLSPTPLRTILFILCPLSLSPTLQSRSLTLLRSARLSVPPHACFEAALTLSPTPAHSHVPRPLALSHTIFCAVPSVLQFSFTTKLSRRIEERDPRSESG